MYSRSAGEVNSNSYVFATSKVNPKLERLLSKSLTTLKVMTYYLVVHTGPGPLVRRRAKARKGVMLTRHHWAKNLHDAGYRPRRMKFPQELNSYVFKTKVSHLHGGYRLFTCMERDGLRHATLPKIHLIKMTTTTLYLPVRSSPGTRTAHSVAGHQEGGEKYATDGPKPLSARNNITIGTWNVRSLRAAGKV